MLSRIDPKLAAGAEWDRVVYVINHLNDSSWEAMTERVPSAQEQEAFAATIERWRSLLGAHDHAPATQPWSGAYWRQLLTSLRAFAEQNWRINYHDLIGNPDAYAIRDRQMGKNLIWLARERYPKRKIVVWAATFHDARRTGTIQTGDAKRDRLYAVNSPMGEVAWKELGNELYSVGFTCAEGESAREFAKTAKPIPVPSHDSLEGLFVRAGLTTAFVDFRHPAPGGAWLHTPKGGQLLGHVEMRADWTGVVDGLIFVRTMQRAHKVE
jgi:erythromycin esterase-like protein